MSFLFAFCASGFCAFISYWHSDWNPIVIVGLSMIAVFAVFLLIDVFYKITSKIKDNPNFYISILALIFSFIATFYTYPNSQAPLSIREALAVLSCVFLYCIFYTIISFVWSYIRAFYNNTPKKKFWVEIGVFAGYVAIITVISLVINLHTELFSKESWDNIFSADPSGYRGAFNPAIIADPSFPNHLYPYLIFMPFATVAKVISYPMFFLPFSFTTAYIAVQAACLYLTVVMISSMMKLEGVFRWMFIAFFLVLAPQIVYPFIIEQFIFGAFTLVAALFLASRQMHGDKALAVACGMNVPSFFLAPFMSRIFYKGPKTQAETCNKHFLARKKNYTDFALDMLKVGLWIGFLLVLFSRQHLFLQAISYYFDPNITTHIQSFSGGTLNEKFFAFTYSVRDYFIFPHWKAHGPNGVVSAVAHSSISIIGVIIFALTILSIIVNYKNIFAWACFVWIAVSTFLFVGMGMGVPRSEIFLYAPYFGWAYIALLFLGFYQITQWLNRRWSKANYVAYGLLGVAILVLFIYNFVNLVEIIDFGTRNYPTGGGFL